MKCPYKYCMKKRCAGCDLVFGRYASTPQMKELLRGLEGDSCHEV